MGDEGHFVVDLLIEKDVQGEVRNDFVLLEPIIVDLDLDGSEEIIFIIRAGYNLIPRKIYSLYPRSQKIIQTKNSAAAYIGLQVYSNPETEEQIILSACNAIENYKADDTIAFNDNSGWIIAYNKHLSEPFFMREYPENKTYIQTSIMETIEVNLKKR
jgi:hypothetical protein